MDPRKPWKPRTVSRMLIGWSTALIIEILRRSGTPPAKS
jgi:hypothetical protein